MPQLERVAVIGAGSVGSAIAYAATIERLAGEIALYDIDGPRAHAEAADLSHGLQFVGGGRVSGGDDLAICRDADLVVVTAGATHQPGGSRLDLAATNVDLVRRLLPELLAVAPDAIYLLVTNPVDVVTYVAQDIVGDQQRVIGTGTVLDSSRLRHALAARLGVAETSIHAMVVGEHGDSEVLLWSTATVGGTPVLTVDRPGGQPLDEAARREVHEEVRGAAARIIAGKGNTNLAIGLATTRIVRAISRDERAVLPVTVRVGPGDIDGLDGEVCLSLPVVVGRSGIVARLPLALDDTERGQLAASAATLRDVLRQLTS